MSVKILGKALAGLLLAAGLVAAVGWLSLQVPKYGLAVNIGAFAVMVVWACLAAQKFKDTEGEKGGVVYADYYEVFKCLSVGIVPAVLIFFFGPVPGQINAVLICGGLYVVLMLIHIACRTAEVNSFLAVPVVLVVKIGLSII